jgi:hypothetical protein
MGLDMTAFQVLGAIPEDHWKGEEIYEWRKHPNMHGWMQQLYARKSGVTDPEEFHSSVYVELTVQDIAELAEAVEKRQLPYTEGFFFGKSDPKDFEYDQEFLTLATRALLAGYRVYYSSSW